MAVEERTKTVSVGTNVCDVCDREIVGQAWFSLISTRRPDQQRDRHIKLMLCGECKRDGREHLLKIWEADEIARDVFRQEMIAWRKGETCP